MDFDQMPYLHHNPGGVAFEGGPQLESYSISSSDMAPGGLLSVASEWSGVTTGFSGTLRLVPPAALRHEIPPLAEVTIEISEASGDWVLELPDNISRGLYLVQLTVHGPDGEARALTPGGRSRGPLYLEPVRVPGGTLLTDDTPTLAPFGPAVRLHSSIIAPSEGDWLKVDLEWSARYALPANYGISLRLLSKNGDVLTAFDTQPGYGYLPTSLWRPGELISDSYLIPSPDSATPHSGCSLHIILYQVASRRPVGEARLGPFDLPMETTFEATPPPRSYTLPRVEHASGATFGDEVELAGYALDRNGASVDLTLWWRALVDPTGDYTVFVHLLDESTDDIVTQSDAMPRGGSYPTSWWSTGEVVSETVSLSAEGLPQGAYRLAVGLYDRSVDRLTTVGADGQHVPDNRLVLGEVIELK
jgi:hypothetical protein